MSPPTIPEWLFYNCFLPLSPVPLTLLFGWLQDRAADVARLLGEGQLAFYATLLSAGTLGDAIHKGTPEQLRPVLACSLTVIIPSIIVYSVAVLNHGSTRRNGAPARRLRRAQLRTSVASLVLAAFTTAMTVYFRVEVGLL